MLKTLKSVVQILLCWKQNINLVLLLERISQDFYSLLTFQNCIFRFVAVTKHIAKSQSVLLCERQTLLQKFNLHFHFVHLHHLWNAAILRHDSIFTSPRLIVKTVEMQINQFQSRKVSNSIENYANASIFDIELHFEMRRTAVEN